MKELSASKILEITIQEYATRDFERDPHSLGVMNGLICAKACIDGTDPEYYDPNFPRKSDVPTTQSHCSDDSDDLIVAGAIGLALGSIL